MSALIFSRSYFGERTAGYALYPHRPWFWGGWSWQFIWSDRAAYKTTEEILRTALPYTHFSEYVHTNLWGRCTLDHFEEWWHHYWRRRLQRVEEEGHHMQLSCTEETSAPANPQRTITQTAASAGGTLLTHGKLSWYYLCCLDPPQGFTLSSFIFPQCSFSLNLLSLLSTNCQRMNMFLKNVLVILFILIFF